MNAGLDGRLARSSAPTVTQASSIRGRAADRGADSCDNP